jgi:hypothetical protein
MGSVENRDPANIKAAALKVGLAEETLLVNKKHIYNGIAVFNGFIRVYDIYLTYEKNRAVF